METIGKIHKIFDTQKVSERFQKREFVLATDLATPYPQYVQFQVTQDKCSILDTTPVGTEVRVQFNLRGREWNGPEGLKYFNTLEAWRVSNVAAEHHHEQTSRVLPDNDDLPF